ncbi:hypothetical protein P3S68_006667 [Capsicum galapagoense]
MCRFFNRLSLNNGGLVPNLTFQMLQSQLRWKLAGETAEILNFQSVSSVLAACIDNKRAIILQYKASSA